MEIISVTFSQRPVALSGQTRHFTLMAEPMSLLFNNFNLMPGFLIAGRRISHLPDSNQSPRSLPILGELPGKP